MKQRIKDLVARYGKKGLFAYLLWTAFKWTMLYFFGQQLWEYFARLGF